MGYCQKRMLGSQDRERLTQLGSLFVDGSSKEEEKCPLVSSNIRSPKIRCGRSNLRKTGLAGIGGELRNQNEEALYIISKHAEIKDSNQVEV